MILEFEGVGTYRLITKSTIERDIVLSGLLRACGANQAMIEALTNGTDEDAGIFAAVANSGKLFDILGATLVPDGVDPLKWTPDLGRETTEKLKHITADGSKQLLTTSIVALVKAFFLAGLHSLATSPNFSREGMRPELLASAAISNSAIGGTSFERSPTSIPTESRSSFAGRCARRFFAWFTK